MIIKNNLFNNSFMNGVRLRLAKSNITPTTYTWGDLATKTWGELATKTWGEIGGESNANNDQL